MKKNLSLRMSSSTPIQALEAKALRAAAIATIERQKLERRLRLAAIERYERTPDIVRKLRTIRAAIESRPFNSCKAMCEAPAKGSSAYAVINVYDSASYKQYTEALEQQLAGRRTEAPRKPRPVQSYVFYPLASDRSRLGSIAIYGNDPEGHCLIIRRMGTIFGIPVKDVSVKIGRSEFVDVRLL